MNRRHFLKGVGAGLLAAAIPASAYAAIPATIPSDRERWESLMRAGKPIQGESFVFSDGLPVTFTTSATVLGCRFKWIKKAPSYFMQADGGIEAIYVADSTFDASGCHA